MTDSSVPNVGRTMVTSRALNIRIMAVRVDFARIKKESKEWIKISIQWRGVYKCELIRTEM